MTIEIDKEQVLKDLATLKGQFAHVHKYYNLSDKEIAKNNFDTIIKDLTEYLKESAMITKETPTEEIIGMLIQVNDELNELNYRENEHQYNYLGTKRKNLEDIILIRKECQLSK